MATYYVNATAGDDTWDGTTPTNLLDPVVDSDGNVVTSDGSVDYVNSTTGPVRTIQQALTLIAAGDTIRVASGTYTAPTGGIIISKSLELVGDSQDGVVVNPFGASANEPVFKFSWPAASVLDDVKIRRMTIKNNSIPNLTISGNYGIQCDIPADGSKVQKLLIEDVSVLNMGDQNIRLTGDQPSNSFFVFCSLNRVQSQFSWTDGLYTNTNSMFSMRDCYFIHNGKNGALLDIFTICPTIIGCAFENNGRTFHSDTTFTAGLRMVSCISPTVIGCDFEDFNKRWLGESTLPVAGDAISGTGIPAGAFVKTASVAAHTLEMVDGGGANLNADATSGVPFLTSIFSDVTIGAHTYKGVRVVNSTNVIVYGNYAMHALNIESCPGSFVTACNFQNPTETAATDQRGMYITDNGTGTVTAPNPVHHLIGPCRSTDVLTAIEVLNTAHRIAVYAPFAGAGTNTVTVPSGAFNVISRN